MPRRRAGLALALVLALTGTACSAGSDADPSASPERLSRHDAQVSLASHPPVTTTTKIHRVHGRLPDARRKVVRKQVGAVVDRWWDAAFLGGTYPRSRFPDAFPGFTRSAEQRARRDKALLTNQTRGPHIDSVTATRRTVALDILATDRQARAATAHSVRAASDPTSDASRHASSPDVSSSPLTSKPSSRRTFAAPSFPPLNSPLPAGAPVAYRWATPRTALES